MWLVLLVLLQTVVVDAFTLVTSDCTPGAGYKPPVGDGKGLQCPSVGLGEAEGGHFRAAWLPTAPHDKPYVVTKCKMAGSCVSTEGTSNKTGSEGTTTTTAKGQLFFASADAPLVQVATTTRAGVPPVIKAPVKLVTFDFDGTTELYDRLAHDVIHKAQEILEENNKCKGDAKNGDTPGCTICAALDELNFVTPEDWEKKDCKTNQANCVGDTGNDQKESTCMGTKACRKHEGTGPGTGCWEQIADAMLKAAKDIGKKPQDLIDTYFDPGVGDSVKDATSAPRWKKFTEKLKELKAKGVELWWLSASWSPVPGAAWGRYLQGLVQYLDEATGDAVGALKLFTGDTAVFSGISGIDDPGPGLAADKGKELQNICESNSDGVDSAEYPQAWYTPTAKLMTAEGKKGVRPPASKLAMSKCWHIDNGVKYAMQAAAVGGGAMHVWGAGVYDLNFLKDKVENANTCMEHFADPCPRCKSKAKVASDECIYVCPLSPDDKYHAWNNKGN